MVKSHLNKDQEKYFSKIADGNWWDPNGGLGLLTQFNELRVPFICDNLQKVGKIPDNKAQDALKGLKILDIGCGGGFLTEALANLGATVVGIEPVEKVYESALKHLKTQPEISNRVTYFCETIEEHCESNLKAYDVIIASEVIEHVEDKNSFIKSMAAALKNSGDIFISCPNKTASYFIFFYIICVLILRIFPNGGHSFSWFIHHKTLSEKFKIYDIFEKNIKGIFYIPIFKKWFLINFKGLWYISHHKKKEL